MVRVALVRECGENVRLSLCIAREADLGELGRVVGSLCKSIDSSDVHGGALNCSSCHYIEPQRCASSLDIGHQERDLAGPRLIMVERLEVHELARGTVVRIDALLSLDIVHLVDLDRWQLVPLRHGLEWIELQVNLA